MAGLGLTSVAKSRAIYFPKVSEVVEILFFSPFGVTAFNRLTQIWVSCLHLKDYLTFLHVMPYLLNVKLLFYLCDREQVDICYLLWTWVPWHLWKVLRPGGTILRQYPLTAFKLSNIPALRSNSLFLMKSHVKYLIVNWLVFLKYKKYG